ncbi:MAG: transcription factor S [Candidatus Woesearchaeota archaeon]
MVLYCNKCGAIMVPNNDGGKMSFKCTKCKHTVKRVDSETKIIKEPIKKEDRRVEVVDENAESLPIVDAECRKCGNAQAYFWTLQTRAGDEGETRFFRCTECKNTWREYD